MHTHTAEDHKKYTYALLARDIRSMTANMHRANIDDDTRQMIGTALEQLEARVWLMSFHDPVTGTLIQYQDRYADGRPVTTTISWGDGYATLVHPLDALDNRESATGTEELAEEIWPEGPQPTDHRGV